MAIKKAYTAIVALLTANQGLQVSDVLAEVIELASAKTGGGGGQASTFHKDEEGNTIAIRCYYHGLWMDPAEVEFGAKASSPTGLNSMCKDGMSKWTKQQRAAKAARNELLDSVANGETSADDLPGLLAEIEETRNAVIPREDEYGYESLEDLLAAQA